MNFDDDGDRIITGPASGEAFQKCYNCVKDHFGSTYYPLCISVMADGVLLNKLHRLLRIFFKVL
jgi:hypothetical protein